MITMPTKPLILAALIAATIAPAPASAGLWRMYRCVGEHGETVFSDRSGSGTECAEMWIETTRSDSSGWVITDSRVRATQPDDQEAPQ